MHVMLSESEASQNEGAYLPFLYFKLPWKSVVKPLKVVPKSVKNASYVIDC